MLLRSLTFKVYHGIGVVDILLASRKTSGIVFFSFLITCIILNIVHLIVDRREARRRKIQKAKTAFDGPNGVKSINNGLLVCLMMEVPVNCKQVYS